MKKIILFNLYLGLCTQLAFSQSGDHVNGGNFKKIVEYNYIQPGYYNSNSKGDVEKLFFGDFNAEIEFFFDPSFEYQPYIPSGFRVVRNSSNTSYILEVKYISNYKEAHNVTSKMYPSIGITNPFYITKEEGDKIKEHNNAAFAKQYEERIKLYKVETRSFSISNQFMEKLYKKMVSFIDKFKAKGVPPIMLDGYSVKFRNVVEDEVWSLYIHMPQGKALEMANLCRQIIEDALVDKFDELKYY